MTDDINAMPQNLVTKIHNGANTIRDMPFPIKILGVLSSGVIIWCFLVFIAKLQFAQESLFWVSSTIAQSMAALLGIVAVFIVYQLEIIKGDEAKRVYEIDGYLKRVVSPLRNYDKNLADEILYSPPYNILEHDLAERAIKTVEENKKEIEDDTRDEIKELLAAIKKIEVEIKDAKKLKEKIKKVGNRFKYNVYWMGTTIILGFIIVPFGKYYAEKDISNWGPSGLTTLAISMVICFATYSIISMGYTLKKVRE